jgi:exopolyphosphatase/guanosine-5'-triphosphate,3'-diphosphate pyrophosphatase
VTRVAVVDIGTNSTRLLIAEVRDGRVDALDQRSIVTRLGEGVDAAGRLGSEPQERVFAVLEEYARVISEHGCDVTRAVMTSAVRDAANGAEFAATVRERYGHESSTLSGDEEARLAFLGAATGGDAAQPLLVIDVGGGSTELVVGRDGAVEFHTSTQVGVVRHSERHLHTDPPDPAELEALAADARAEVEAAVPEAVRADVTRAVAVGGSAAHSAAVDLELDPYIRERIEGHELSIQRLDEMLARLGAMTLEERRGVTGLEPSRAPTIVAGMLILTTALRSFGLQTTKISERDILWGVALISTSEA